MEEKIKYIRKCPECGNDIEYLLKKVYNLATKKNKPCRKCTINKTLLYGRFGSENGMFGKNILKKP